MKKYIDDNHYDRGMLSLEESLYVTCVITGEELSCPCGSGKKYKKCCG